MIAKYAAENGIVIALAANPSSKPHIAHCKISAKIEQCLFNIY